MPTGYFDVELFTAVGAVGNLALQFGELSFAGAGLVACLKPIAQHISAALRCQILQSGNARRVACVFHIFDS